MSLLQNHLVAGTQYIDNLRINDNEYATIIDDLDKREKIKPPNERRVDKRYKHDAVYGFQPELQPGDEEIKTFQVRARNISANGIGIFCGRVSHVGTICVMEMTNKNGEKVSVRGEVVHCRRVWEHVHEVGVHFNQSINIEEFIGSTEKP